MTEHSPSKASAGPSRAESAAACCAAFYEHDEVRALFGDSFHPGGVGLSHRLIDDLSLASGQRVLDLACGTGTTARLIDERADVEVTGLDFSAKNLAHARAASQGRARVRFVEGRADALPFGDGAFDAVLSECAVSTFADKRRVASEVARVTSAGGRLAISDMAVYGALPDDLRAFGRGWACVDDALTVEGYQRLFVEAGFEATEVIDESDALLAMTVELKKKLLLAGFGALMGALGPGQVDVGDVRRLLDAAKALVVDGRIRYARLGFRRAGATG